MPEKRLYRIVDLFAGIGGLSNGVVEAIRKEGHDSKIVFTSEIKKPAIVVLKDNHKNLNLHGDIRQVLTSEVPPHDILLAGFPCQAFSTAGNQRGFEDKTRGTLFFEVARILKERKPEYFILENVEGLILHDPYPDSKDKGYGKTLDVILSTLTSMGYNVKWGLLDATHFGVAQRRKRVFIVGSLTSEPSFNFSTPSSAKSKVLKDILQQGKKESDSKVVAFSDLLLQHFTLKELQGKIIRDKRGGDNNLHSWNFNAKGVTSIEERLLLEELALQSRKKSWATVKNVPFKEGMPLTVKDIASFYSPPKGGLTEIRNMLAKLQKQGYLVESSEGFRIQSGKLSFPIAHILSPQLPTPTLVATDADRLVVADGGKLRRLTLVELKRLFGFADSFVLDETKLTRIQIYDLFGNSVVQPVAEAVCNQLLFGNIRR